MHIHVCVYICGKKGCVHFFFAEITITPIRLLTISRSCYLLDQCNSISRFLGGPLLLTGNSVYSPETAPNITIRLI